MVMMMMMMMMVVMMMTMVMAMVLAFIMVMLLLASRLLHHVQFKVRSSSQIKKNIQESATRCYWRRDGTVLFLYVSLKATQATMSSPFAVKIR